MWQTLQLLFPKLLFPPPLTPPPKKKMDEFNIKLSQYCINKIFELTKSCIWSISANCFLCYRAPIHNYTSQSSYVKLVLLSRSCPIVTLQSCRHNSTWCLIFHVLFWKRVRGSIRFQNASKHLKPRGRRPNGFIVFRAFGNLMKSEARGFEITSPANRISRNYHFNKFSEFKYFVWDVECEPVTYLLLVSLRYYFICIQCHNQCHIVTELFVTSEQASCLDIQK